ncbi:hypothetical protein CLV24_107160 [Pontibacter ummariensis]|uniref:Uncharacterized protein n=1 Tax=Pontibacter ummariensis TaxID=1610492 RepID=A0A239ESD7_9BACT|nr:hypothetical protein CLV24_107160 [Pontibacter ummariensis]SNS47158.1 hypothetical protein SAMN06296052_10728 [Pontibacter ummariensis]
MGTNRNLSAVKHTLLYLLFFSVGFTFLQLWDTWKSLLTGTQVDWATTFSSLNVYSILSIALPVSVALGFARSKRIQKEKGSTSL